MEESLVWTIVAKQGEWPYKA